MPDLRVRPPGLLIRGVSTAPIADLRGRQFRPTGSPEEWVSPFIGGLRIETVRARRSR